MLSVIDCIKCKPIFLQRSFHICLSPPFDHPEVESRLDYIFEYITYFCTVTDMFSGFFVNMSDGPLDTCILNYIVITC